MNSGVIYFPAATTKAVMCLSIAVKHNPHSGNLRTLVKKCLELATSLRDESQCERLVVEVQLCQQCARASIC